MKAILELDGFTKLIQLKSAALLHKETLDMDGIITEILFVRLGQKEVDGEDVILYKMLEPNKDLT